MARPLSRLLALTVALVAASCSDASTIAGPADVEPSFSHVVPGPGGSNFTLVEGQLPAAVQSVSKLIGAEGGQLVLPGPVLHGVQRSHKLTVPAGAVKEPTLFVMEIASSTHIIVDLAAYKQNNKGKWTGVGHLGFQKPVYLQLSYAFATDVPVPPSSMSIVYLVGDKVKEKNPSRTFHGRKRKYVEGELRHFSRYAVAAE